MENTNTYLQEKLSSHVDGHKIQAVDSMYKLANILLEKNSFAVSLPVAALAAAAVPAAGWAGMEYVEALGRRAAKGFQSGTEEAASDWKDKAMVAVPTALLALGGAAKAGLLGDSAKEYADGLGEKAVDFLRGKDKESTPEEKGDFAFKVAVAKTYCKLKKAHSVSSGKDRSKIASALNDCSVTLFDLMLRF